MCLRKKPLKINVTKLLNRYSAIDIDIVLCAKLVLLVIMVKMKGRQVIPYLSSECRFVLYIFVLYSFHCNQT